MNYDKLMDSEKEKIIKKLYVQQKKSFAQIAKDLNTYSNKIRRDAIKFKVKIRDKSEAQKNALKAGTIEHPTKGKKRSEDVKSKIGFSVMNSWKQLTPQQLKDRQKKAKDQWDNMSDEKKENMIKMANDAVRESSKTGSKLEKFLLRDLLSNGYNVDFHKEHNLLNTKLQIDLFLPSLNVAIEVDGPSHFLPVWGEDTLKRNIKYDNKKTGLLLGKGCVIIRIRQTRDFSPSRARILSDLLINNLKKIEHNFPDINNRTIELGD